MPRGSGAGSKARGYSQRLQRITGELGDLGKLFGNIADLSGPNRAIVQEATASIDWAKLQCEQALEKLRDWTNKKDQ